VNASSDLLTQIFIAIRNITIGFDLGRHKKDTALGYDTAAKNDRERYEINDYFQNFHREVETFLALHGTAVLLRR